MQPSEIAYLAFGGALVAIFVAIIAHYYAKARRSQVEQAKYKMLDDDEE